MRECKWSCLLDEVAHFCEKHGINLLKMDDMLITRGRRSKAQEMTNLHHYRVELFYRVIDIQLQELNAHFTESNTELLLYVACLSPVDSFSKFDKIKLIRLTELYPKEFSSVELLVLHDQLDTYVIDIQSSSDFSMLNGISDLAKKWWRLEEIRCIH